MSPIRGNQVVSTDTLLHSRLAIHNESRHTRLILLKRQQFSLKAQISPSFPRRLKQHGLQSSLITQTACGRTDSLLCFFHLVERLKIFPIQVQAFDLCYVGGGKGLDKNFTPAPAERLGGFPDSLFQP
jgi:hypothetical protein